MTRCYVLQPLKLTYARDPPLRGNVSELFGVASFPRPCVLGCHGAVIGGVLGVGKGASPALITLLEGYMTLVS
jgi:hypothetical protein